MPILTNMQPSTWEAMFRAELGSNNRENALALLERLKTRYVAVASNCTNGKLTRLYSDNTLKPFMPG